MNTSKTHKELVTAFGSTNTEGYFWLALYRKGMMPFSHDAEHNKFSVRNNYVTEYPLEHSFSSLVFNISIPKNDKFSNLILIWN